LANTGWPVVVRGPRRAPRCWAINPRFVPGVDVGAVDPEHTEVVRIGLGQVAEPLSGETLEQERVRTRRCTLVVGAAAQAAKLRGATREDATPRIGQTGRRAAVERPDSSAVVTSLFAARLYEEALESR